MPAKIIFFCDIQPFGLQIWEIFTSFAASLYPQSLRFIGGYSYLVLRI